MPPERTSAPNDSVGSIRTKGAKALDNVQTDELQHLGFEQAVRRELLHVHKSRDWVHPAGSTQITRYIKYWFGVLGPASYETTYIQPTNDVLDHLGTTWFSPTIFFNAIFAYALQRLNDFSCAH
jgi:hypothetical protein